MFFDTTPRSNGTTIAAANNGRVRGPMIYHTLYDVFYDTVRCMLLLYSYTTTAVDCKCRVLLSHPFSTVWLFSSAETGLNSVGISYATFPVHRSQKWLYFFNFTARPPHTHPQLTLYCSFTVGSEMFECPLSPLT